MNAILSLSGGLDSATVLLDLLDKKYNVTCFTFNYGQKHHYEINKAVDLVKFINSKGFNVKHKVLDMSFMEDILYSSLISGNSEVPEGRYSESNMRDTVVPNRNKIFSSIIQASALSVFNETKIKTCIAMGVHAGDHDLYRDCTPQFRKKDYEAFLEGNYDAENVVYYTPFMDISKDELLAKGLEILQKMNIDYKDYYIHTLTSYKPKEINGEIYSDFKSASSIERIEAFITNDAIDPIKYFENNNGISWNTVKEQIIKSRG
ncbi:7-cyano-7-deazaguanine synthase [Francisellaceae bacterium CB299]|jgi:7-cyano-7-deazaguanine synthase